MRALLGTASHFSEAIVLKSRTVPNGTTLRMEMQTQMKEEREHLERLKKHT